MALKELDRADWVNIFNAVGIGIFFALVVWAMQLCTT